MTKNKTTPWTRCRRERQISHYPLYIQFFSYYHWVDATAYGHFIPVAITCMNLWWCIEILARTSHGIKRYEEDGTMDTVSSGKAVFFLPLKLLEVDDVIVVDRGFRVSLWLLKNVGCRQKSHIFWFCDAKQKSVFGRRSNYYRSCNNNFLHIWICQWNN